ncbi:MAG: CotH kinase family protein, partial [Anaerotignum sp.]|nr:CotH kinase family protein [Anaerotignum sp.]
ANLNINGEVVGNVAIRTKGNTSLTSVANSDSDRYSFKIDFDYYDNNGNYYGLKKLCLNNNYADNSYMREYIGYKVMEDMGLPVPACGYSHITVNGEEWGLYLAVEAVDEVFLQTRFADATGDLYKPEGMGGTGANLVYSSDNISDYTGLNLKTNLESSDGSEIIALMKALESGEGLEEVLDIDNALKYIAASVVLTNFDSYLGATTHNYYLYEENGVFSVIPWDINLAFGGFGGGMTDIYDPASGGMFGDRNNDKTDEAKEQVDVPQQSGGKENAVPRKQGGKDFLGMKGQPAKGNFPGMGEKTKTNSSPAAGEKTEMSNPSAVEEKTEKGNMPEMGNFPAIGGMPEMGDFSAMEGITSFSGGGKPLVDTLLVNEALLARYEDYLREFTEKYLTEEYMAAMVTEIHDLIAPYVEKDATAFYTYEEFEQGCSVDPEDEYSLVYYAVNMAESIQNQLAGGEPTFDASSLKGGGMGFGGGKGGMPAFGGDMKLPEGVELPDGMQFPFEGKMPSFGDGMEFTFGDEMPFDMMQQAEGQKEKTESSAESGQKIPFG